MLLLCSSLSRCVGLCRAGQTAPSARAAVGVAADSSAPLAEITRVLNIHRLPASSVLDHVSQFASADGTLSRASFVRAFQSFLVEDSPAMRQRAAVLLNHLFSLFDRLVSWGGVGELLLSSFSLSLLLL